MRITFVFPQTVDSELIKNLCESPFISYNSKLHHLYCDNIYDFSLVREFGGLVSGGDYYEITFNNSDSIKIYNNDIVSFSCWCPSDDE